MRSLLVGLVVLGMAPSPVAPATAPAGPAAVRYTAPVPGRVVRAFEQPAGPYGPGHRGADLAAADGEVVRSAADGTVTFAGAVAGRGVVVVRHADGIRTEYEPLTVSVAAGTELARGAAVGTVSGRHAACRPNVCVHWSARRGEQYIDPLLLLRPLGPVRLLPWSGDG